MTAPVIIIITRPPAQNGNDPLPPEVETTYGPGLNSLKEGRAKLDEIIEGLS